MNNTKRIIIITGILGVVLLLVLLLWQQPERHNWLETYKENSREPYGAYVIFELLKSYFPNEPTVVLEEKLSESLPLGGDKTANYISMGEGLLLDSADVEKLLEFVEQGNKAFIFSRTIPFDLMDELYFDDCDAMYWDDYYALRDSVVLTNLVHPALKRDSAFRYTYIYRGKTAAYRWQYIDPVYFCDSTRSLIRLGMLNDSLINFAKIKYGAGDFFLHTNPIVFTNLNLLEEEALNYADRVFSHLEEGPVYWDKYGRISEATARRLNNIPLPPGERRLSNETPLQYILSQPSLAWAWYTLLAATLLYLAFRAKRKQRIIPVLEENNNTSLEFVRTIGRLYFLQNNHRQLCLQKMKLFKAFVREKYQLVMRGQESEELVERLANKSEVSPELIEKIFSMYRNIESSSFVSENTLIAFHQRLDAFYKNCR